jgi:hypothetical protein
MRLFAHIIHSASCHTQGVAISALPDLDRLDNDALKALALQLESELRQQRETVAQQEAELATLEAEFTAQRKQLAEQSDELRTRSEQIEHLKLVIEKLRRTIFGKKSEKITVQLEQLELELEELETAQAAAETVAAAVRPEAAPAARPRRKPLPEHLRREELTHAPGATSCPDCGGSLKQFGEDVSEQLEYVPESFKVIHLRPAALETGRDTSTRLSDRLKSTKAPVLEVSTSKTSGHFMCQWFTTTQCPCSRKPGSNKP